METTSCVRAVVTAAGQYENNPSDAQLVQLQRQLDVCISLIFCQNCKLFKIVQLYCQVLEYTCRHYISN